MRRVGLALALVVLFPAVLGAASDPQELDRLAGGSGLARGAHGPLREHPGRLAGPGAPLPGIQLAGIRLIRPQADFLPEFTYQLSDVLGALIRNTRETPDGPFIMISQRAIVAGEALTVTLRGAASGSVVVDVYRPGDVVQHVPIQSAAIEGADLRLSMTSLGPASGGPALLVGVTSANPLELGTRPRSERASAYLPVLRQALLAGGTLRADMAAFDVHPAPVPAAVPTQTPTPSRPTVTAAPRPPVRPPRCASILARAQLGEDLSDGDRAFLRSDCR